MSSRLYISSLAICYCLFIGCGGGSSANNDSGASGSGGSSPGTGGTTLGGSGGSGTGGDMGTGGTMPESTGGAPGTGGADMPDANTGTGGDMGMDAAPEVMTTPGMCAAKPALTDPALSADTFCQELATACKGHIMAAFNTTAKCTTAYGKLKNQMCSSYHLCLVVDNAKVAAANCGTAQMACTK